MAKKKAASRKKTSNKKAPGNRRFNFDFKAYWQSKSPIFRFFLLWAGLTAIFYVIWYTDFFKGNVIEPWNHLNAWIGAGLLSIFGQGTTSLGTVISGPGASINIKEGCDAIEPTMLFVFGVLAFPALWKLKWKGILYGMLFLLSVNFIRIITLYFAAKYWPEGFEFMHIEFWQVLYVLLAIGAWGYWLFKSISKLGNKGMNYLPKNPVRRFLLLFAILYSLFLIVGVTLNGRSAYQQFFRTIGEGIFGDAGTNGVVRFLEVDDTENYNPKSHTLIMMGNRVQAQKAAQTGTNVDVSKIYVNDYMVGFLPTMTLLALLMATPMPRKRKIWAVATGLIVVTLFVILRQWVLVLTDMANNPQLEMMKASEGTVRFLIGLKRVFVTNIVVTMMVPFLLWGMIVFRVEDLKNWLGEDIQHILKLK